MSAKNTDLIKIGAPVRETEPTNELSPNTVPRTSFEGAAFLVKTRVSLRDYRHISSNIERTQKKARRTDTRARPPSGTRDGSPVRSKQRR